MTSPPGLSIGGRHLSGQHKPYPDPPKMNGGEMLVEIQFYREDAGGTLQTDAIRVIASDNATAIKRALTAAAGKPYYRRIIGARVTD